MCRARQLSWRQGGVRVPYKATERVQQFTFIPPIHIHTNMWLIRLKIIRVPSNFLFQMSSVLYHLCCVGAPSKTTWTKLIYPPQCLELIDIKYKLWKQRADRQADYWIRALLVSHYIHLQQNGTQRALINCIYGLIYSDWQSLNNLFRLFFILCCRNNNPNLVWK